MVDHWWRASSNNKTTELCLPASLASIVDIVIVVLSSSHSNAIDTLPARSEFQISYGTYTSKKK